MYRFYFFFTIFVCNIHLAVSQTVLVNYNFGSSGSGCSAAPATASGITCAATTSTTCVGSRGGVAVSTPTAFATNSSAGNSFAMRSPILVGFVNDYFQFQLGGSMLNQYSGLKIFFNYNVDNSIGSINFQYSTDGSSWTSFSSFTPAASWGTASLDLSGITTLNFKTAVYFRIVIPLSLGVPSNIFDPFKYVDIDNFQVYSTCMAPQLTTLSNITQCAGTNAAMSMNVSAGTTPFTYQWLKNNVSITAATASSYTINAIAAADGGSYSLAVTNACSTKTSNGLTLTVNPLPTIANSVSSTDACFSEAIQSSGLSYSATTNSPVNYTITWDATALSAGLVNAGNTVLPASTIPLTIAATVAAGTYNGSLRVTNANGCVSGTNGFTLKINPTGLWIGGASGDWNNSSNWCGGIPSAAADVMLPANAVVNIQSANAQAHSVNIATNSSLVMTGSYNLSIASGGSFTNNGLLNATSSTGAVIFLGNASISGTTTFNNIDTYGALNFGTASTVTGRFTLQTGGSVTGYSPFYSCPSSSLVYKTGSTFTRGLEWGSVATGAGYPSNVSVQNNTTINFSSLGDGYVCNDLFIESGAALLQNYSGGSASLHIGRNITINGTLSLGNNNDGDIYVGGNWVRNPGGVFNHNDRKVIMEGTANFSGNGSSYSTISAPASAAKDNQGGFGGEQFAHLWINKTNATDSVVLLSNITITRELGFTKGIFSLKNSDVTMVSNSTRTADIAPVINNVDIGVRYGGSGRFVVQRFIQNPTSVRSWRLLSAPLQSADAPSINEAFQEGKVNPDKNNPNAAGGAYNPWPGYGTHITGLGGSYSLSNGYDDGTSSASILFLNSSNSWASLPSTINTRVTDEKGWMLFVRGDRGFVIGNQYVPSKNTTLEPKGKINVGDVVMPVIAGRQVMSNPYASAISLLNVEVSGSMIKNGNYLMWDPKMFTSYTQPGKWVTFTGVGNAFEQTSSESPYADNGTVESGQAFLIDAPGAGTITFHESDKLALTSSLTGIANAAGARPVNNPNYKLFRSDIYVKTDTGYRLTDGVLNIYKEDYSNAIDQADAGKLVSFNTKESLSILRDSGKLAIEKRSDILMTDTIFYSLSKFNELPYQFRFTATHFNPAMQILLEDHFTGLKYPVSSSGSTAINFNINADPLSKAANRFSVVFTAAFGNVLAINNLKLSATQKNNLVNLQWKTDAELNVKEYEVERSKDGIHYEKLCSIPVYNYNVSQSINQWLDKNPFKDKNYYRIHVKELQDIPYYSNVVCETIAGRIPDIFVYPNPVTNGVIHLHFRGNEKGVYFLKLINLAQQEVQKNVLDFDGTSADKKITINKNLPKGIYHLEVSNNKLEIVSLKLIVE